MKAIVITKAGHLELQDVPEPTPSADEVVIEVAAAGICGTDLHIRQGEEGTLPITPGHEFAGTIVALGASVTGLAIGDRVGADPNIPCRMCRYCQDGRINLCENYSAVGVTRAGAAADYVAVPANLCVPLPDNVSLEHAAFAEPLSCAVHAIDLLEMRPGQSVLIIGAGTMGLAMLQLTLLSGAPFVDVVDINDRKLAGAAALGARHTATTPSEIDTGRGWDVVIDATGNLKAIQEGLNRVARGGTFLQFGVASPGGAVSIDPHRIYEDELRIIGAVCPASTYRRAIDLLESGRINIAPLISHRVPLDEYAHALEAFRRGETKKVLVLPGAGRP
ncbi:zinc-dependent alcohol dehydrogenase family protein [Microbacterium sp. A204]|uniref:zinc-dependent alcohol dehydrogenase family protein n=1 Tax=Microbacterium sp. A204 TaxID=3457321 RepID=UPI003FD434AF